MTVNQRDIDKALIYLVDMAHKVPHREEDVKRIVALLFPPELEDQIEQLIYGPVWDGHLISKHDRDRLLRMGLAVRVCDGGRTGYTAATEFAHAVRDERITDRE